jgi:hypothetical protein
MFDLGNAVSQPSPLPRVAFSFFLSVSPLVLSVFILSFFNFTHHPPLGYD